MHFAVRWHELERSMIQLRSTGAFSYPKNESKILFSYTTSGSYWPYNCWTIVQMEGHVVHAEQCTLLYCTWFFLIHTWWCRMIWSCRLTGWGVVNEQLIMTRPCFSPENHLSILLIAQLNRISIKAVPLLNVLSKIHFQTP